MFGLYEDGASAQVTVSDAFALIAGMSGSGKSNFAVWWVTELSDHDVVWAIADPKKGS